MRRSACRTDHHDRILDALRTAGTPMTAYELLDLLRPTGISAPPTVYRALGRLTADGLAHRIESINAYVACANPERHRDPAAFAICNACGRVNELSAGRLIGRVTALAQQSGFRAEWTTVELTGLCAACARPSTPARKRARPQDGRP